MGYNLDWELRTKRYLETGNVIKSVSSTGWVGLEEKGRGARKGEDVG